MNNRALCSCSSLFALYDNYNVVIVCVVSVKKQQLVSLYS